MALFKIYKGKREFLPTARHEGYVYFTTDEGMLYVDIDNETRIAVNAAVAKKLIDEDDNVIEVDQLVQISDIIPTEQGGTGNKEGNAASADKLKTPRNLKVNLASTDSASFDGTQDSSLGVEGILNVSSGGTGGGTPETARENLSVYSKLQVDDKINTVATVAYNISIPKTAWVATGDKFQYEYENTELSCGSGGNVPPVIIPTDNQADYNNIESAEATAGTGISFITSKQPTEAIGLTIIDMK